MNLFDIPTNTLLAQIIGGCFTGFCLGTFIPSEYEKNFSFAERKKIWKWKNDENLTLFTLIVFLIKALLLIGLIAYINAEIAKYFDAFPMFGNGKNSYSFVICFFIMVAVAKKLRYLYFKSKMN